MPISELLRRPLTLGFFWLHAVAFSPTLASQDAFEREPIRYSKSQPHDRIQNLQDALDANKRVLEFDTRTGYLRSLLKQLDISTSSQLLVYSKTSLQLHRIAPHTPRAIYFNDDVYIGFIPGSDRLEISTADPQLGGIFYVLQQDAERVPQFVRDQGNCLACHATSRTQGVPGHLMRSVYTSPNGQPHYSLGTHLTTHESPFTERFGGWYATGKQGKTRHLANLIVPKREDKLNLEPGANLIDLSRRFQTDRYLTPHSDWIALMVLAHQAEMHNLMTLVNFQTRQAIHQGQAMNKALDRDKEFMSDSTRNRINRAVESLLDYMLFVNEAGFESPMSGTSGFGEHFQSLGPFDKQGRSLRQFDLKSRTFKYRCSYLIYSGSFRQLPQVAKDRTLERLWEILTGKDESAKYTVIPAEEKLAIRQILTSTLKDLPKYWR